MKMNEKESREGVPKNVLASTKN